MYNLIIYTATLSQEGTAAPTIDRVLANGLGGNVVWTRVETGVYEGTIALPKFLEGKTIGGPITGDTAYNWGGYEWTPTKFRIATALANGTASDDVLNETPIEIRVYQD